MDVADADCLPQRIWFRFGWRVLFWLNPMTGVVEGFRWSLFGEPQPDWGLLGFVVRRGGGSVRGRVMLFPQGGAHVRGRDLIQA